MHNLRSKETLLSRKLNHRLGLRKCKSQKYGSSGEKTFFFCAYILLEAVKTQTDRWPTSWQEGAGSISRCYCRSLLTLPMLICSDCSSGSKFEATSLLQEGLNCSCWSCSRRCSDTQCLPQGAGSSGYECKPRIALGRIIDLLGSCDPWDPKLRWSVWGVSELEADNWIWHTYPSLCQSESWPSSVMGDWSLPSDRRIPTVDSQLDASAFPWDIQVSLRVRGWRWLSRRDTPPLLTSWLRHSSWLRPLLWLTSMVRPGPIIHMTRLGLE